MNSFHNVWINHKPGDTCVNAAQKLSAKLKLSNKIEKVIGIFTIKEARITQISVKPDMIRVRLLQQVIIYRN